MPIEPSSKRVAVFIDGQNLFYAIKHAFGYQYPNYNPSLLARAICQRKGWTLRATYFYTGIPDKTDNAFWHNFWSRKLAVMGTRDVRTFSRPLRYRHQSIALADGSMTTVLIGQEKGIDIRIALDVVRRARENHYDVALVFSQDQDLSEVADEVKAISIQQQRWIRIACAFPISPTYHNKRGINGTEWIKFDRAMYDTCLDPTDYRG